MNGRLLNIKKSTWLYVSLVINAILFLSLSMFFSITYGEYQAIFYFFCICTGLHQMVRSALFGYDSSCYLGVLLFFIGLFYFWAVYFEITWLYVAFIALSFAFSSFSTGIWFKQPFQIFLSCSIFFEFILIILLKFNIFSLWIFVAISVANVLVLVVKFFFL